MRLVSVLIIILLSPVISIGQIKYAKGLRFDTEQYRKVPKKASLIRGDYEDIPDNASVKQFSPYPGNQLQLNTSVSWAVVYGARTIIDAQSNGLMTKSEISYASYSPVFNYVLSTPEGSLGCKTQTTITAVLESLKEYGVPKYVDFLEFCPDTIPQSILSLASRNKITDYVRLFDENDAPEYKIDAVKKSLAEGLPVVIGIICPPSFFLARDFWQPREKVSDQYEGHALCVVGYDDSKFGGAFEVLNSWGKNWGNEGYIWIRYPDFVDFTKTAFEMFLIGQDNNKIDFSGEIKLVLEDGQMMDTRLTNNGGYYQTTLEYRSGTNFRIYISNNETAYVYVFGTDKTNEFFPLFPYDNDISPVLNYKSSSVALPSEDLHIQITGDPGRDYLVILYSKEELQLPDLMAKLQQTPGRIDERMQKILGDYIIEYQNINWEDNTIKFSGTGKGKSLVPVFIEIQHN